MVRWDSTWSRSSYPAATCDVICPPQAPGGAGYSANPCFFWAPGPSVTDPAELAACFDRPDDRATVIVVGDSHAAHWLPALAAAFVPRGLPVLAGPIVGGCGVYSRGFIDAYYNQIGLACDNMDDCYAYTDALLDGLNASARPGDIVAYSHWTQRDAIASYDDGAFLGHVAAPRQSIL